MRYDCVVVTVTPIQKSKLSRHAVYSRSHSKDAVKPEPRRVPLTPDTEHSATRRVLKSSAGQSQQRGVGTGGRAAGLCPSAEQRAGGVRLLLRWVSAPGACYT